MSCGTCSYGSLASPMPDPGLVGGDARGGDVGAAGYKLGLHAPSVGHGRDDERHAQLLRERARQLELEPFRAVRAEVERGGTVERDDAQLAARADLVEGPGLGRAARGNRQQRGQESKQQRYRHPLDSTASPQPPPRMPSLARIPRPRRRGTEAVITAPTRNRMVG